MKTLSYLCSAAAFSVAATFNQGAFAQEDVQNSVQTAFDVAAVFDRIRHLPDLTNPEEQCVPARVLDHPPRSYIGVKIQNITDIISRDEIGQTLMQALYDNNSAICFSNMTGTVEAKHYAESAAVILNNTASEGCQVSALIHETQHAAQHRAGLTAPVRDLEMFNNQEKLILAIERDAATIQTLVGWRLAHPSDAEEPYVGALDCLYNDYADDSPYFARAADILNDIQAEKPSWIENGQAARHLYEVFATDREHWVRYSLPLRWLYFGCGQVNGECFLQTYTLDDLGIDLSDLGRIHFDTDYRQIPYDETLGSRPVNEDRPIPRYVPLP